MRRWPEAFTRNTWEVRECRFLDTGVEEIGVRGRRVQQVMSPLFSSNWLTRPPISRPCLRAPGLLMILLMVLTNVTTRSHSQQRNPLAWRTPHVLGSQGYDGSCWKIELARLAGIEPATSGLEIRMHLRTSRVNDCARTACASVTQMLFHC